jgi:hypothetical protein
MAKTNLCIVLILIVIIIYLLETSSCKNEYMTSSKPSPESLIGNFKNDIGLGASSERDLQEKTSATSASGITPFSAKTQMPGSTIVGGNSNAFDMTTVKSQPVDSNIINYYGQQMAEDMKQQAFNVKDFLPKEINSEWFQTDLSNATNELDQATLIEINKYCSGIDTVGQSLKNPSYDIRGNVPCPKMVVSPFLNSSYDADNNIKSWC